MNRRSVIVISFFALLLGIAGIFLFRTIDLDNVFLQNLIKILFMLGAFNFFFSAVIGGISNLIEDVSSKSTIRWLRDIYGKDE